MQMNADHLALDIEGVEAEDVAIEDNSFVYDLQGRRHDCLQRGLNIVRTVDEDGTVRVRKVIRD